MVKTMQFEPATAVYDACRVIRERVPEAQTGQGEQKCYINTAMCFVFVANCLFFCSVSVLLRSLKGQCVLQHQSMGSSCQTRTQGKVSGLTADARWTTIC